MGGMAYSITVDKERRRIATVWGGVVTDETLLEYQKSVWTDPTVRGFDELIDFRGVADIQVSSNGLRAVAGVAAAMDDQGAKSRFAIVVGNPLSFGLARMYEAFRGLDERATRDVVVFEELEPALSWLDEGK